VLFLTSNIMDPEQNKQEESWDTQTHTPASSTPDEPTPTHTSAHAHNNAVMLGVLAVIIVVLALLFMWSSQVAAPVVVPEPIVVQPIRAVEPEPTPEEAVSALEAELDMPEIDTLDSELDVLEAELDAELEAIPVE